MCVCVVRSTFMLLLYVLKRVNRAIIRSSKTLLARLYALRCCDFSWMIEKIIANLTFFTFRNLWCCILILRSYVRCTQLLLVTYGVFSIAYWSRISPYFISELVVISYTRVQKLIGLLGIYALYGFILVVCVGFFYWESLLFLFWARVFRSCQEKLWCLLYYFWLILRPYTDSSRKRKLRKTGFVRLPLIRLAWIYPVEYQFVA